MWSSPAPAWMLNAIAGLSSCFVSFDLKGKYICIWMVGLVYPDCRCYFYYNIWIPSNTENRFISNRINLGYAIMHAASSCRCFWIHFGILENRWRVFVVHRWWDDDFVICSTTHGLQNPKIHIIGVNRCAQIKRTEFLIDSKLFSPPVFKFDRFYF